MAIFNSYVKLPEGTVLAMILSMGDLQDPIDGGTLVSTIFLAIFSREIL